jgi:hypothetical protein
MLNVQRLNLLHRYGQSAVTKLGHQLDLHVGEDELDSLKRVPAQVWKCMVSDCFKCNTSWMTWAGNTRPLRKRGLGVARR